MNAHHMKRVLLIAFALLSFKSYAQEKPSKDADSVVVVAICVEPANIVKDIPQEIEYIRVYTQYRKPKTAACRGRARGTTCSAQMGTGRGGQMGTARSAQ